VELTRGFWLAEAPVTQRLWQAVVGSNPSKFTGDDRPVEQVSWDDCQVFLQKANGKHGGLNVRLPTEAEWEYACRAGTTGPTWLGKNEAGVLQRIAWYDGNSGNETHPVKQKAANPWGLYDILGNVWEWCSDWLSLVGYPSGRVVDPTGPGDLAGAERVCRGGSWAVDFWGLHPRAAYRSSYEPETRIDILGFRLARGQ
jgi:formylglycine-generating enzyme required for sulfatase activity